jgi:hypothetical protein
LKGIGSNPAGRASVMILFACSSTSLFYPTRARFSSSLFCLRSSVACRRSCVDSRLSSSRSYTCSRFSSISSRFSSSFAQRRSSADCRRSLAACRLWPSRSYISSRRSSIRRRRSSTITQVSLCTFLTRTSAHISHIEAYPRYESLKRKSQPTQ